MPLLAGGFVLVGLAGDSAVFGAGTGVGAGGAALVSCTTLSNTTSWPVRSATSPVRKVRSKRFGRA